MVQIEDLPVGMEPHDLFNTKEWSLGFWFRCQRVSQDNCCQIRQYQILLLEIWQNFLVPKFFPSIYSHLMHLFIPEGHNLFMLRDNQKEISGAPNEITTVTFSHVINLNRKLQKGQRPKCAWTLNSPANLFQKSCHDRVSFYFQYKKNSKTHKAPECYW